MRIGKFEILFTLGIVVIAVYCGMHSAKKELPKVDANTVITDTQYPVVIMQEFEYPDEVYEAFKKAKAE